MTQTLNLHLPREKLERFGKLLSEYRKRQAKSEQSRRGWYDANGVRQGGLIAFVRYFWSIIEPDRAMVDGWALWAMVEHLEAVTFGEITRLLMNVPPGFMKSLLVDVFWPAWEWGPMKKPFYRYIAFSYSAALTERDNERFRSLVASERYQKLYGPFKTAAQRGANSDLRKIEETELSPEVILANKTTLKVKNTRTGWKLASSVGGIGTGERGDRVIIDDPHNVIEAESETVRGETVRWFRESVSSRFNDMDQGALIVIMQRVHDDDVSGTITRNFLYCHVMIPWEFDPTRNMVATTIGWLDPRYNPDDPHENENTPAWPERFSEAAMERTKAEVGPYAWAAQYQQRPAPRGGGIFQESWWQLWESADGKYPPLDYVIASLDGAFTEDEENDPCGFTVWGTFKHPELAKNRIILLHAWRKHLKFSGPRIEQRPNESWAAYKRRTMNEWGLMEWVVDTCRRFKVDLLLIEAKANGISAAQELRSRYTNEDWAIQLCPVKGDKVARALAVQPTFSQLLVYAPERDWSEMVIEEMGAFPKYRTDDLTDSATQAIHYLRGVGLAQSDAEVQHAVTESLQHKPKAKALYPV